MQGLRHFIEVLLRNKKSRFIPLIGNGTQPIQTIAIDDLSAILENAMNLNISGKYNIAEAESFPIIQLYQRIADKLNKKIYFIPFPAKITYVLCKLAEFMGISLPVSSESVLGLKQLRSFKTTNDIKVFKAKVKPFSETIDKLLV